MSLGLGSQPHTGQLRRCLAHAVPPRWDVGGQSRFCFHGFPLVRHHNGWKTFPYLLLCQQGVVHDQEEALYLQGLSEDNHRHCSQHGVGHAGLIGVAQADRYPLGLAVYKLAVLPCHCCSSAGGICWCSLSTPSTTSANHLPNLPSSCAWLWSVRAARLPEWWKKQVLTLRWMSSPTSLIRTLLCPAHSLQGQGKQVVLC